MIELLNVKPGDLIQSEIAYIFGKCIDTSDAVEITSTSSQESSHWKIKNCFFKAFIPLTVGKNTLKIQTENCALELSVFHEAVENDHQVRVLYVVCHDDTGNFQSPDTTSNDSQSATKRISLNVKLLQTFLSEIFYKEYGERKTFSFTKREDNVCEIFTTKLGLQQALNMKQKEIFIYLANEIRSCEHVFNKNCKYIAVLSFTRYVPPMAAVDTLDDFYVNMKGFCALGAEWLAVYGTGSLYTWPERINDIEKCFLDNRIIDEEHFLNDTAFRNTYWAAYSTSLGSLLHEFSHILDLGHNESGIMARGFDDIFSFFTVNFDTCVCYDKFKKNLTSNKMIERVILRECDVKEGQKLMRKEVVLVMFKNSPEKTFEIVSILTWNKNSIVISLKFETKDLIRCRLELDYIFSSKIPGEIKQCNCLLNSFYEECNLNILFNHRWLNCVVKRYDPNAFKISFMESSVVINSSYGLLLYELRDYSARTVDSEYFSDSKKVMLRVDFEKYKNVYNSLELFVFDSFFHIQKFKLF